MTTNFEKYATDHEEHTHCAGCGGCMLDPRIEALQINPVWCVACIKRIDEKMPIGAPRPWANGLIFHRG